jgi:hypothetical protein
MYSKLASRSGASLPRQAPARPALATHALCGSARAPSKSSGSHWRPKQGSAKKQELPPATRDQKESPSKRPRSKRRKQGQQLQAAPARIEPAIGGAAPTTTKWLEDLRQEIVGRATWKKGLLFADLFSGKNCPVGQEVGARGGAYLSFDVLIDARFDLNQPEVEHTLMRWIRQGLLWGAFLGTDCTTWSPASYSKGPGWFNSYRSQGNLWGELASLSPKAQEKVLLGNAHARFSIRVLQAIADQPLAVGGLENPLPSVIWKLPEFLALGRRSRTHHSTCHYCQYGTPWKKPTKLLFVGGNQALAPSKLCRQRGKRCSRTKKPHLKLGQGRRHPSSGAVLTKLATEYPQKLASQIVDCMAG